MIFKENISYIISLPFFYKKHTCLGAGMWLEAIYRVRIL